MQSFDSIQLYFSQFDPLKLLAYLDAINCHPSNQRFIHRFEHLIAIVLSIPSENFQNKDINHEEFALFLNGLEDKLSDDFAGMEDIQPLPQDELVPLFHNHQTYQIFYGMMNNPVADWEHLLEMVRPVSDPQYIEQANLYEEMREHLEWQNEILRTAKEFEEFYHQSLTMYVPSEQFIKALAELMVWTDELPGSFIPLEVFFDYGERHLLQETTMLFDDFESRQIKVGNRFFRLHSQNSFPYFQKAFVKLLHNNTDLHIDLQFSFNERLQEICLRMFRGRRKIRGIIEHPSHNDLFGGPGLNFNFDGNKIFVFYAVHREAGVNVINQIQTARKKLEDFQNRIKGLDTIGIILGQNLAGLVADKVEWIVVYVTESLDQYDLEPVSATQGFKLSYAVDIVLLKQIFAELRTPIEVYKFIEEENWLHSNYQLTQGSGQMNRFASYVKEGRNYGRFAHIPDGVYSFENRDWGSYIHQKLFKRYNTNLNFYKEVCRHYDDYFDNIKPYNQHVYLLRSSIFFQSIYVINFPGYFVPVWLPEDPSAVPQDAYRIGFDVLATMFADYLGELREEISQILRSNGVRKFMIAVYPKEYFSQEKAPNIPREVLDSIDQRNPLVVHSNVNSSGNLHGYIIYDYRFVHELFQEESNNGERALLQRLLESILTILHASDLSVLEQLIDKAAPVGQKGYAVDNLSVDNYDLVQYDEPLNATRTDRARVRRKMADFLKDNNYLPANYSGTEAKSLVYDIYKFMQKELEKEIALYIDAFNIYAYQQIEYNEGKIEQDKVRSGMHVQRRRNYDIRKANVSDYSKRTSMTSISRYLLHTGIKVQPCGEKIITECDWCYLMAMTEQIIQLGISWSLAEYKLETIEIEITDLYEYLDQVSPGIMDFGNYQLKEADGRLRYAKELFNKAAGKENADKDEAGTGIILTNEEIEKVVAAFDSTYNVSFQLILDIIEILSRYEYTLEREFPCYIASLDQVTQIIMDHIDQSVKNKVKQAIEFLTLRQADFVSQQFLYHEILFKQYKRLTLCPLIQLPDGNLLFAREVVDGCRNNWMEIVSGRLPFEYDDQSHIGKELNNLRVRKGRLLEELAESIAVTHLGKEFVEARIKNFKRLSVDFERNETCGEIDLLCINTRIKTLFVIDCKCLVRKVGLYQTHRNIEEFFKPDKGYYTMLMKKRKFVSDNLQKILEHFKITDSNGWSISDAFVVNITQYAEFRFGSEATFILPGELQRYLEGVSNSIMGGSNDSNIAAI